MAEITRKIYTRFGDRGETKLLSGETIAKDDPRVEAYGTLDELQSHLGMARCLVREESVRSILYAIQKDLFIAGAELASTTARLSRLGNRLKPKDISKLEHWIDQMTDQYGMPGGFVIPGNSPDNAALHMARSVCRRVERLIVRLNRSSRSYADLIVYINRLSDLLFVLAWSTAVTAAIEGVLEAWPTP
jgi:cob(I)alamin adenosyltransferase